MNFLRTFIYLLKRNRLALACFAVIAAMAIVAVFAPAISPYDPNEPNLKNKLSGPSGEHWLGTDQLGETFSAGLFGGQGYR